MQFLKVTSRQSGRTLLAMPGVVEVNGNYCMLVFSPEAKSGFEWTPASMLNPVIAAGRPVSVDAVSEDMFMDLLRGGIEIVTKAIQRAEHDGKVSGPIAVELRDGIRDAIKENLGL